MILTLNDPEIVAIPLRSKVHEVSLDYVVVSLTDDQLDGSFGGVGDILGPNYAFAEYPFDIRFTDSTVVYLHVVRGLANCGVAKLAANIDNKAERILGA